MERDKLCSMILILFLFLSVSQTAGLSLMNSEGPVLNSAPNPPSDPDPTDGEDGLGIEPVLSVYVSDDDGGLLNVTFHDSSDDSIIGTDNDVPNGDRASVIWSGLSPDTNYSWYAVVDDGENTTQGGPWNFSTASVDYVEITDGVNGTSLTGGDVPPNYQEWGNLSAYNNSYGFVGTLKADWSVSGNATLLFASYNEYNGIDVGNESGNVWFNVTYNSTYTDSVKYNVLTDTVDHVEITDSPNGTTLSNDTVVVGDRETGYCSVYNDTEGFLYSVAGNWSVEGGSSYLLEEQVNQSNTVDVGLDGGRVWFNLSYAGVNDSVRYDVIPPSVDDIRITDNPGGNVLSGGEVPVGYKVWANASAYNDTADYFGTVVVDWSIQNDSGMNPSIGFSSSDTNWLDVGTIGGSITWKASYYDNGTYYNHSVSFKVSSPTIDSINITQSGSELVGGSVPVNHTEDFELSGYNDTSGFVGFIDGNWSVEGGNGYLLNGTNGTENGINVGTLAGTVWLNASYGGLSDDVTFDVIEPTVDHIDITDGADGASVDSRQVDAGTEVWGNCSAYNDTVGYLGEVKPKWTAEGGDAQLVGPEIGVSSGIDVGKQDAVVFFNASYNSLSDSVIFSVQSPGIDYIEIRSGPMDTGSMIMEGTLSADEQVTGYAAGYNVSLGYVKDVEVNWSVENSMGAEAYTEPLRGNSSVLHAGIESGKVIWKAEYSSTVNDSVSFTVEGPDIDYIQIHTEPGGSGDLVRNMTYEIGDTDYYYAAGYNSSYGYQRDVLVSWASENQDIGSVYPEYGTNTTFTALDSGDGTVFAIYSTSQNSTTFTVIEEQKPQIVNEIPDVQLEEDFGVHQLELDGYASDKQDSVQDLRWFITGVNKTILTTTGENHTGNHIISFISQRDEFGSMHVRYWLVDSDGNTATQEGWINVTAVNDEPVIRPCPDLYVHFDDPYVFDYSPYVSDVDDPRGALSLDTDDPQHTTVNGLKVTFEYPESMTGDDVLVKITVSDGDESSYRVIRVTVTSDYPPENVKKLPDIVMDEGERRKNVFDLDDYIMDPDEDSLYMSYGYTHLNITIHDNHSVDFHASGEWNGHERVTFRAEDPVGAIVEQTMNVTVLPVNDPPKLKPLPPFVVHYDHPYTFDLRWYISDDDNDIDELTITTSSPDYVTVMGTRLRMLYPERMGELYQNYTIPLTVYVSDGIDSTFRVTTVTVGDDYPPEVVIPLHDVAFKEDEEMVNAFDLDEHFVDVDSETIFYTSGNENITVDIHNNHTVDFSAPENWYGEELITIRATDDHGALIEDSLTVSVIPVNDAPVISEIPTQYGEKDKSWILDMENYISDIDDDTDDLQISVGNPNVEVARHKLIFTYEEVTNDTVLITVSDGDLSNSRQVNVSVKPAKVDTSTGVNEWMWALGIIPIGLIGAVVFYMRRSKYAVEDIFLIHNSGVLIKHTTRTLKAERDEDILAGMFTAVENFVKDAFAEEEDEVLKRMDYGDKKVLVHKGGSVILAVFFSGEEPKWALEGMKNLVADIEERYEGDIEEWSGDLEDLPGITKMLHALQQGRGKYKQGDWKKYE